MLRRKMRSMLFALFAMFLSLVVGTGRVTAASAIRINEVGPDETSDFIELYVATSGNYAGFNVYANTSSSSPTLVKTFPSAWASLSAGSFIVLHFNDSTADETSIDTNGNGYLDIYTTEGSSTGLQRTDNTIFLGDSSGITFSSGSYSSGVIVDFMCFANQDATFPSQAVNNINSAVSSGQWSRLGTSATQFDCVNSRGTYTSDIDFLARDNNSSDTESKADWSARSTSTSGAANDAATTAAGLGSASITPTTANKGATGTWTITYTAANPNTDTTNHMLLIRIPDDWTVPQTTNNSAAGYTTFSGSYSSNYPGTTNGQFIIVPTGNMANSETVTITYGDTSVSSSGGATAPNTDGIFAFRIQSDDRGTNVGAISSVPTVTVGSPTAVALSSFTATNNAAIALTWTTASEINTAGFNLYRSAGPTDSFTRLNAQLIRASNDPILGGKYRYEDNDVTPGQVYLYQLEDVELSGKTTRHQPITVTAAARVDGDIIPIAAALGVLLVVAALRLARVSSVSYANSANGKTEFGGDSRDSRRKPV